MKAISRRLFDEAWSKGNLSVVDEHIADTHEDVDPNLPFKAVGKEGFKQIVQVYRTAFPDLHFAIEDVLADGETTTTRWTATGTHNGPLGPIAATGKKVSVTGIVITHFKGTVAQRTYGQWDAVGMLTQLGVIPKMG